MQKLLHKAIIFILMIFIGPLCSCASNEDMSNSIPTEVTELNKEIPYEEKIADRTEITVNTEQFLILKFTSDVTDAGIQKTIIDYGKGCKEDKLVYGEFQTSGVVNGKFQHVYNYGFMDKFFNVVIEAKYIEADPFSNGVAIVKTNEGYGVIDVAGNRIIDCMYVQKPIILKDEIILIEKLELQTNLYHFHDVGTGLYKYTYKVIDNPASENYDVYQINQDKEEELLRDVSGPIADLRVVYQDAETGNWGFKDGLDRVVCQPVYEKVFPYNEGIARVKKDDKIGYIDIDGDIFIDFIFNYAFDFSDDTACVNLNGKYGYINKLGAVLIDYKFAGAKPFMNGAAAVKIEKNKWFYIDNAGEKILTEEFYRAGEFINGYAPVESLRSSLFTYIDMTGQQLYPDFNFEYAYNFNSHGTALAYNRFYVSGTSTSSYVDVVSIIHLKNFLD